MVPRVGHTVREPGWSAHFVESVFDGKLLESLFMRITEAARRLGTSARMLRYREDLGLLPRVRGYPAAPRRRGAVSGPGAVSGRDAGSGRGAGSGPGAVSGRGAVSGPGPVSGRGAAHRVFSDEDVEAVAAALELERRYDISPAALAFGVRVLAEPAVVRRRIGYVSQLGGADEISTGRENLVLQGRLYGQSRAQATVRVAALPTGRKNS